MKKSNFYRLAILSTILILLNGCKESNQTEVNVYSARKEALIKPLFDKFTQDSGIKVNLITGSADALLQRLKSEGANSPADIFITVDAGRLYRAKQSGVTQSLENSTINKAVPQTYRDPNGHWYGLSLRARPIIYSLDRVSPTQLSNYSALGNPEWQNKLCIRSSTNIYNQSLVASMVASLGSIAVEKWIKTLVANFSRDPVGGDRDQIKAIAAGACDLTVANTYYLFGMLNSNDESERVAAQKVGVFWPNQSDRGAHVNISGVALTSSSKNKDNAIKLIEYLVQSNSQAWYAEANGEYPVREGVEMNEILSKWGEFKKDSINLSELGENNAEAVKLMDRAGWK